MNRDGYEMIQAIVNSADVTIRFKGQQYRSPWIKWTELAKRLPRGEQAGSRTCQDREGGFSAIPANSSMEVDGGTLLGEHIAGFARHDGAEGVSHDVANRLADARC